MTAPCACREEGSGTILALCLVALLSVAALTVAVLGQAVLARQHAESAADLSALAAASTDPAVACRRAAAVAAANRAQVRGCRRGADGSYTVEVAVALPPLLRRWLPAGVTTARARAGEVAGPGFAAPRAPDVRCVRPRPVTVAHLAGARCYDLGWARHRPTSGRFVPE